MAKKTIEKTQPMDAPPVEEHDDELDEGEEEDDELDEEDDEDEHDEHDGHSVVAHSTRVVPGRVPQAPVVATHEPQRDDPSWWLPHAVLGTLIVVGILGFFGVFTSTLHPLFVKMGLLSSAAPAASSAEAPHEPAKPAPSQKPAAPTAAPIQRPTAAPMQPKPTAAPVQPAVETFAAKHIVVAYKGALNANAKITRSKDDAKKRATEAHSKLKKGGKWDELVAQYSDEDGAGAPRFGNLGRFTAATFDKSFIDAVRKLKKDEMSDVVETPMGFEIIVRTE